MRYPYLTLLAFLLLYVNGVQSQNCTANIPSTYYACRYQTVTLTTANQPPGAIYQWTVPPGLILLQNNGPSIVFYCPNPGTFNVQLTQNCPLIGSLTTAYCGVNVPYGLSTNNPACIVDGPDTVIANQPRNFGYTWGYNPIGQFYNHAGGMRFTSPNAVTTNYNTVIVPTTSFWHTDSAAMILLADHPIGKHGIRVFDNYTCPDSAYTNTVVLGALAGPAVNCQGDIVTYNLPVGTVSNWSVVGGTILSGQGTSTVTVQWNVIGTDSVICTWSHGAWGTHTTRRPITVGTAGNPTITGNLSLCSSPQIYSITSQPGHSYRWTVNGVTTSLTNTLVLTADNNPAYSIQVTDSIGTCVNQASIILMNPVYPHPTGWATVHACKNAIVNLSVSPVTGATYTWNATGGTIVSGAGTNAVAIRYGNSGNYSPSVQVSVSGCNRTASGQVIVYPNVVPNLGPDQNACAGTSVNLTNSAYSSGFIVSHAYSPNLTNVMGPTMTAPGPGLYWVQATTAFPQVTCVSRDTVNINPTPSVTADLGPNLVNCASSQVLQPSLSGVVGAPTYLWSTGATTSSITVTATGDYSVTVTSAGACSDADTIQVDFPSMPPISLPSATNVCPSGSPTTLNAPTGYNAYLWSTAATTQAISVAVPGTYSVTVSDAVGCTSSASTNVTNYTAPSPILGNDTLICPDTFAVLQSAPFVNYLWSTGATTSSIQGTAPNGYAITVTDANGCTWSDNILALLNSDCIWPGDANHDGVADNADIVDIAFALNATGTARPSATTSWYGQTCQNWLGVFPSGLNYKHADADGNGVVAFPDTLVVVQNYGLTHNKGNGTATDPPIMFQPLQASYAVGDTVDVAILLGDATNPLVNLQGVAYSVAIGGINAQPGDVWFDFPVSYLGIPGSQQLAIAFEDIAPGLHSLAQGRIGNAPVNGHGPIAVLHVRTDSLNMPLQQNLLSLNLSASQAWTTSLGPLPISPASAPVLILVNATQANAVSTTVATPVTVFPVPADRSLIVLQGVDEPLSIVLADMTGRPCKRMEIHGGRSELSTLDLSSGSYMLTVLRGGEPIQWIKVIVMH